MLEHSDVTGRVATVAQCEDELLARLRAGDETAFRTLVKRHHQAMGRVAVGYVKSAAVADEVVQTRGWR